MGNVHLPVLMGGFILENNTNASTNQITILNATNCLNYNLVENQIFAQKVNIPLSLLQLKERIRLILQWYIYVRNFGCVHYNNTIVNLNRSSEANEFLHVLEEEQFLHFIDERTVEVIDPNFNYIGVVQIPFLWVNLLHKKLPELSDEQIEAYNQSIAEKYNLEGK